MGGMRSPRLLYDRSRFCDRNKSICRVPEPFRKPPAGTRGGHPGHQHADTDRATTTRGAEPAARTAGANNISRLEQSAVLSLICRTDCQSVLRFAAAGRSVSAGWLDSCPPAFSSVFGCAARFSGGRVAHASGSWNSTRTRCSCHDGACLPEDLAAHVLGRRLTWRRTATTLDFTPASSWEIQMVIKTHRNKLPSPFSCKRDMS